MKRALKFSLSIIMAALFLMCAVILPIGNAQTVYADTRNHTVTIYYNHNDGTGTITKEVKTVSMTYYLNHVYTGEWINDSPVPLKTSGPSRAGYTFMGWGTGSQEFGTGSYTYKTISYICGPLESPTLNLTRNVYGKWHQNAVLKYDANGGSGAPGATTLHDVPNTDISFTVSNAAPKRTGYTFLYWSTSKSGGDNYSGGSSIKVKTGETKTLYAIWQSTTPTTYYAKVTFDANGGSGGPTSATGSGTSTTVNVSIPSTKPTRTGYTFKGWATSASATSASYQPGGSYAVAGCTSSNTSASTAKEVKLYAVWENIMITYQYTYNGNPPSGKTVSGVPSSQSNSLPYNAVSSYQFTISSTKPTCSGYTFKGWSTSASGSAQYQPGGKGPTLTRDNPKTTLYAVWQKNSTTTPKPTATPTATPKPTTAPTATPKPTTKPTTAPTATPAQKTYTIKYSSGGASGVSGIPSNTVEYGTESSKKVTITSSKPTRTGYTFKTWNTSADGTGTNFPSGSQITVNANGSVTLYAIWTKTYTVKYSAGGASGVSGMPGNTVEYGMEDSKQVTITSTKPTRSGYTFKSWNTAADGSGTGYNPGGKISVDANKSVTLYATWKQNATPTPTVRPTATPTQRPTTAPTAVPTRRPTAAPTQKPTAAPTQRPANPTSAPVVTPEPTTPTIDGPTIELEPANNISDGMKIVIYNAGIKKVFMPETQKYEDLFIDKERSAITTGLMIEENGTYIASEDSAILTLEVVNADSHTYAFVDKDGKYLYCNGVDVNYVIRDDTNKNYTLFVLEEVGTNKYNMKAKAVKESAYLKGEMDYITCADLTENDQNYVMMLFEVKGDEPAIIETPEPVVEEPKSITIKVVDGDGFPLEDVRIALYDAFESPVNAGYSKSNGLVTFESVAEGDYKIKIIEAPQGFDIPDSAKDITIDGLFDESNIMTFTLTKTAIEPVETPEPINNEPTPEPVIQPTPAPIAPEPQKSNINWTLIALIGGGALLLIGAILIVVMISKKKQNKKDYNDDEDQDDDYE